MQPVSAHDPAGGEVVVPTFWWRPLQGTTRQKYRDIASFRPRAGSRCLGGMSWTMRNFGDELTPWIVSRLQPRLRATHAACPRSRLTLIGSVVERTLAEGPSGLVVLGAGLAGPNDRRTQHHRGRIAAGDIHFGMVRGHRTREALGLPADTPVGDPGLAVGEWQPRISDEDVCLILHFGYTRRRNWRRELESIGRRTKWKTVLSGQPVDQVIGAVSRSNLVLSSSLHGVIVADSLGVPALPITLGSADYDFRFDDYHSALGLPPAPLHRFRSLQEPSLRQLALTRSADVRPAVERRRPEIVEVLGARLGEILASRRTSVAGALAASHDERGSRDELSDSNLS